MLDRFPVLILTGVSISDPALSLRLPVIDGRRFNLRIADAPSVKGHAKPVVAKAPSP